RICSDHSFWRVDFDRAVRGLRLSEHAIVSHGFTRIMSHLLTILILLPVAGALALVGYSFVSSRREEHYRWIALITTVATFAISLLLLNGLGAGAEFRFEKNISWIGSIGANYHIGVDGVSLWLVLLTTLLVPIAVLSSWTASGPA